MKASKGFAYLFVLTSLSVVTILCLSLLSQNITLVKTTTSLRQQTQFQILFDAATDVILSVFDADSAEIDTSQDFWATPWSGQLVEGISVAFQIQDLNQYFPVQLLLLNSKEINVPIYDAFQRYLETSEVFASEHVISTVLDILDSDTDSRGGYSEEQIHQHIQNPNFVEQTLHALFPDEAFFSRKSIKLPTSTRLINVNTVSVDVLSSFVDDFSKDEEAAFLLKQRESFKSVSAFLQLFPKFAAVKEHLCVASRFFLITLRLTSEYQTLTAALIYDRKADRIVSYQYL